MSDPVIRVTRLVMLTSHGQLLSPGELKELGIDPMPDTLLVGCEIRSGAIFDRLDALKAEIFWPSIDSVRA